MPLTWPQVLAWRVHQQFLDAPAPADAWSAVANRLCGLHAQLMSSAELTLWVRLAEMPRDLVQTALWEQRCLVKSWATRGTLHLFTATEYPTWQAGLEPVSALSAARLAQTLWRRAGRARAARREHRPGARR